MCSRYPVGYTPTSRLSTPNTILHTPSQHTQYYPISPPNTPNTIMHPVPTHALTLPLAYPRTQPSSTLSNTLRLSVPKTSGYYTYLYLFFPTINTLINNPYHLSPFLTVPLTGSAVVSDINAEGNYEVNEMLPNE